MGRAGVVVRPIYQRLQARLTTTIRKYHRTPVCLDPSGDRGSAGQAKATYRSDADPRVTANLLRFGFTTDTARRRLEEDVVLVVQDTTSLNFTGLHMIPELGPIDRAGWRVARICTPRWP